MQIRHCQIHDVRDDDLDNETCEKYMQNPPATRQNAIRDKDAGRMKSADDERGEGRQVEKNTT